MSVYIVVNDMVSFGTNIHSFVDTDARDDIHVIIRLTVRGIDNEIVFSSSTDDHERSYIDCSYPVNIGDVLSVSVSIPEFPRVWYFYSVMFSC